MLSRMSPNLTPEQFLAISAEMRQGNKIQAVKLYREATGCGLAEAKNAVESMEAGFSHSTEAAELPPTFRSGLTPELRSKVLAALRAKKKIEAIKNYREATGLGLAESKDAVEAMEGEARQGAAATPRIVSEPRTPLPAFDPFDEKKKSGCFGVLMLVIGALAYLASH